MLREFFSYNNYYHVILYIYIYDMYEALSNRIMKTIIAIFLMYYRNLHYMRFYYNYLKLNRIG